jgi:hypothetical protein
MSEQWLPVLGYGGAYEVSSLGRVRSVDRVLTSGRPRRGKTLRAYWRGRRDSYLTVHLAWAGSKKLCSVHALVLRAFRGACPEGMEARHLDGDRSNNCQSNLRWGTKKENGADRRKHGTAPRGERSHNAKLTDADVRAIRKDLKRGVSRLSIAAARGVSKSLIHQIAANTIWTHV